MKSFSAFAFVATLAPALASGQTVQNFIIDPSPPIAPLEKTVDYFTSTTMPSVVLGSASGDGGPGGYFLYQSANGLNGPWTMTTIDPIGDAYERTRAFTWPGDTFPGFMASRSGQLVWYFNPMNWGGDPTQPWPMEVINPNAGCHDMRIVDVEQSGFPAVVCSSVFFSGTSDFIAFNNGAFDSWTIVNNPFNVNGLSIGDFVAPLSVSGSAAINFVGATTNGVYWFRNPRLVGGNARTGQWTPFLVGGTGTGQAVGQAAVMNTPYGASTDGIVAVSSEEQYGPWTPGLVWYTAGSDPQAQWTAHPLDSTHRAVHEINSGVFNGTPYFILGEQEQAGGTPSCPAEHPGIPSRVMMFSYGAGAFSPALELSTEGTQSQSTVMLGSDLVVVGANHNLCPTPFPALQEWLVSASSNSPLPNGTYRITSGSTSVDGGFGFWNDPPPPVQLYSTVTSPFQHWTWNGSTLLDAGWPGHYMGDAGNGTVSEPTGAPDTWTVTQSGAGWTVKDNRTGNYLTNQAGSLTMSPTQTVWTMGNQ
jgi:hypothetical protein